MAEAAVRNDILLSAPLYLHASFIATSSNHLLGVQATSPTVDFHAAGQPGGDQDLDLLDEDACPTGWEPLLAIRIAYAA